MDIENKYTFILDTLRTALAVDTTFVVTPVWQAEQVIPTGRTLVYINIISDTLSNNVLEGSRSAALRQCTVGIIARFNMPATKFGNGDFYYGDVVERIDARLDTLDTTIWQQPLSGTTRRYQITLHGLRRDWSSGFIDDGGIGPCVVQHELVVNYIEALL